MECPQHVITDTVDNAIQHKHQLQDLLKTLEEGVQQVQNSANKSKADINQQFCGLEKSILEALRLRKEELLAEILDIENLALDPLKQCKYLIEEYLGNANAIIEEGKKLLHSQDQIKDNLINFHEKTACLGSLPEVPHLSEVPYISINFPSGFSNTFATSLSSFGNVTSQSPVQIKEIVQRAGGLLVRWCEIDDDASVDTREFRLQFCYGNVKANEKLISSFHDVYHGPDLAYTVRNLMMGAWYSFRVCCRSDGDTSWSPWSICHVAKINIPHYEWENTDKVHYTVSNLSKIGTKVSATSNTLYSKGPVYTCGHSIQFRILETGLGYAEDGIGLAVETRERSDTLIRPGVITIHPQGYIYIDGTKMTTHLPKLDKGSGLLIETEALSSGKIRITVETKEKQVTFDWNPNKTEVQNASKPSDASHPQLYFVMSFQSPDWKVQVE